MVNHIVHIGENFGYDIVGLGGDFNGAGSFAKDADTIAKYPNIMAKVNFFSYNSEKGALA